MKKIKKSHCLNFFSSDLIETQIPNTVRRDYRCGPLQMTRAFNSIGDWIKVVVETFLVSLFKFAEYQVKVG